jgi:peptide-methionine (R)-S-oxide reductase
MICKLCVRLQKDYETRPATVPHLPPKTNSFNGFREWRETSLPGHVLTHSGLADGDRGHWLNSLPVPHRSRGPCRDKSRSFDEREGRVCAIEHQVKMNIKDRWLLRFVLSIFAGHCFFTVMTHAEETSTGPTVRVRLIDATGMLTEPIVVPKVQKTDAEWRKELTADQYVVARGQGTEQAFCGTLLDNHRQGIYHCVCCGLPLFASDSKFDSGTGWPSFFQPVAKENVVSKADNSFGMQRTEILCSRCDAHLGHVFPDGPPPTRLRFCLNSAALTFVDKGREIPEAVIVKAATAK